MNRMHLLLAMITLALLSTVALAQGRGRIEGQVIRDGGSGVGGISVEIQETSDTRITDNNGFFSFSDLSPGTYTIIFTLRKNTVTESGVTVTAGASTKVEQTVDWELSFLETVTVFSASRRIERIVDAPAAVTVVTEEEIEREASHGQLPKLLEFTPGAEVTQSGIYDYNFNTRGFNSSLNRRVATLIDGRDPSVPFLGAQEWAAVSFPLDDIASLELVRGPSAALYGANASSGVLNMTTKQPRFSEGGRLRLTAGELSTANVDFRWAGALGADWFVKVNAGLRDTGDFTVSRVGAAEYTVPCPAATDCLPQEAAPLALEDDDRIVFGSLRFDKYLSNGSLFTIEGGTADIEGPVFQTGIGRVQLVDVQRPWGRFNFSSDHWNFLAYYNKRDAARQLALSSDTNLVLDTDNVVLEVQTNWDFAGGKTRVVAGASYGEEDIDSLDPATGLQTLVFQPVDSDQEAVFSQFDWNITDAVKLVLAGRWDDSSLHDSQFSPKGSVVYRVNTNHTLRFTYNEAFQVANYSEFFLQADVAPTVDLSAVEPICAFNNGGTPVDCGFGSGATRFLALGNKDLELEEVKTFEVGYTGIIGGKTFLTVEYYNSDNENFITDLLPELVTPLGRVNPNFGAYVPPPGLDAAAQATLLATLMGALGSTFAILSNNLDGTPMFAAASYTNFGEVDTQGADLGLNHYFSDNWTLVFNYSWFDFDIKEELPGFDTLLLPNSPENKFNVALGYVGGRLDGRISVRWVDDFRWGVGPFQGDVESYTTVDLNGNYALTDHWKVGINVANLLDEDHWEAFGGDLLGRRALAHVAISW